MDRIKNKVNTHPTAMKFSIAIYVHRVQHGVRDMEEVISVAETNGFYIHQIEPMPANNYSLVFIPNESKIPTYDVFDFVGLCCIGLGWIQKQLSNASIGLQLPLSTMLFLLWICFGGIF